MTWRCSMHKCLQSAVLKIQSCLDRESRKRDYYVLYTVFFLILAFFCFSWFFLSGKSFIWGGDGWEQHFKALRYYAKYLRDIIRHLIFERRLIIPEWDFNIGEGAGIISTLNYYVMGDPIALLSVFVPTIYLHYFYNATCILRLYLAGIAFSELCFGTGLRNRYGILSGTYSYIFSTWALSVTRHIFFANPMIYFPLMILGIEKVINKKKPYLFIFSAAISAASNFYFFYMIVILAITYTLIRLGLMYRDNIREGFITLLKLGGYAVTGVCIAGLILLPVLMIFTHDSRLSSSSQPFQLLYPMSYYSQLPSVFISNGSPYWLCLGLTAPVVLAVFLLFRTKKASALMKILVLLGVLIMLFPIAGRFLNGMSYISNRWTWGFIMLCCYILASEWDHLLSLSGNEWRDLFIISFVYFIVCMHFDKSSKACSFATIIMLFISLAIMREKGLDGKGVANSRSLLLIGMVMLGVINYSFWMFSTREGALLYSYKTNSRIRSEYDSNEAAVVKRLADSPYDRFSGRALTQNANMAEGISSTQYYWTISNPYVSEYRTDLDVKEGMLYYYDGYDDRTVPLALATVKYFTVPKDGNRTGLPYGYKEIDWFKAPSSADSAVEELCTVLGVDQLNDEQESRLRRMLENNYYVYENEYILPRGYCYDSYITPEEWKSLNVAQRQQSLLSTAVVDEKSLQEAAVSPGKKKSDIGEAAGVELPKYTVPDEDYVVPYESECSGSGITELDCGVVTTANNQSIKLTLSREITNSETYVSFEGLDFVPVSGYDRYLGDDSVDPLNQFNQVTWKYLNPSDREDLVREKFYWNSVADVDVIAQTDAGTRKSIFYMPEKSDFSSGRHNFIINLGYLEDPVNSITITFTAAGIYNFDSLKVYQIGMEDYPDRINSLKKNSLKNLKQDTNAIYGDVEISPVENGEAAAAAGEDGSGAAKILCVAVPYDTGWKGFIDGEEAKVLCVNEHYLGLLVPEGSHKIAFHYSTPFKKAGAAVTLLGFILLALICIYERRHSFKQSAHRESQ